jgi:phosphate transport system substrate-binding protein
MNLINNETDIILSARKMSPDEKAHADDMGVTLIETPIALDAFIFIVNPNNPITSLTIEEIQNIYTGKITNWNEVGGNNAQINPYVRNANSGSQELMESLVMKDLGMSSYFEVYDDLTEYVIRNMTGAFIAVSNDMNPNAICYSIHYVYAVIRSDLEPSSMAYKLFEYLQTESGKDVIRESGYIPPESV